MPEQTMPAGDLAQRRLREYAEAFERYRDLSCQVPADHPERRQAHAELDRLEAALIGDLTANAPNGAVTRAVFAAYDAVDKLGGLMEDVTDALAAVQKEEGVHAD